MRLIQEGDEISYRCAFSCFSKKYTPPDLETEEGQEEYQRQIDIVNDSVDTQIKKLLGVRIPGVGRVDELEIWLTAEGKSNFRYGVAKIKGPRGQGYKAGRAEKPYWLQHVKRRLIDKWGAQVITGYEADDGLGMASSKDTILSHIDKDINMIPGWHYNHVSEENYFVEWDSLGSLEYIKDKKKIIGRGMLWFYAQMLLGDATDNIPGITGIGPKTAYDMLKYCSEEKDAYSIVRAEYTKQYGDDSINAFYEIADLLYIVREIGITGRKYLISKGYVDE